MHISRTKRRKVPTPEGVITTTEILKPEPPKEEKKDETTDS